MTHHLLFPALCECPEQQGFVSRVSMRHCGEIGRHEGLKIPFWRQSAGSSPAGGMKNPLQHKAEGDFLLLYRVQSVIRRRQECRCSSAVFHSIESFQEAVVHTLGSIARHGINGNIVDAAEDAVFDIGIVALQAAKQDLDLLPLGTTAAVVAHGAVLGKAAGTLDEFQIIVALPGQDIFFPDAVHGADQGHAGEAGAVELGRHGLHLGAVEHAHYGRLNDIVEVVAQRDLIASQLLGLAVQVAAPHPGTEVAGVLFGVVGNGKDVALEDGHRDVQQLGIGLDLLAVDLIVAGVHHQKDQLKGNIAVLLQLLHQLCHQHGVFAA